MLFEWDEEKSRKTFERRRFDFAYALRVFDDPDRIERMDRRDVLMTMKTGRIVKGKIGADGKLRRADGRGGVVRARVVRERLDHPAAFEPDADTPVLTRRELREFSPVSSISTPDIGALRRRLHLSQGAFAMIFGIPLPTIKDWEQGRRKPDAPARAYLRVIAQNPRAVREALSKAAE